VGYADGQPSTLAAAPFLAFFDERKVQGRLGPGKIRTSLINPMSYPDGFEVSSGNHTLAKDWGESSRPP